MKKISGSDANRLRQLEQRLGSRLVRTILTDEDRRLMRPGRMDNLIAGRGRLSADESERLTRLSANAQSIEALKKKRSSDERHGLKRKDFKVNRAIRDWVNHGKERDAQRTIGENGEQNAIRGLRFFGVDPSEKHYYLRKVKA
jgi:hypothetical protein